jgi:hypothetical protein
LKSCLPVEGPIWTFSLSSLPTVWLGPAIGSLLALLTVRHSFVPDKFRCVHLSVQRYIQRTMHVRAKVIMHSRLQTTNSIPMYVERRR